MGISFFNYPCGNLIEFLGYRDFAYSAKLEKARYAELILDARTIAKNVGWVDLLNRSFRAHSVRPILLLAELEIPIILSIVREALRVSGEVSRLKNCG